MPKTAVPRTQTEQQHTQTDIRRRLASFVLELLEEKSWSKEKLGRVVSVSGTAVQGWTGTNDDRTSTVDPLAMKVGTFFALADLRGWSGNQLYDFLVGHSKKKDASLSDELINLLNQATTLIKRNTAMRNWAEFLRDLSSSLTTSEHRSRFAAAAQISEGALDALLGGEMMLDRGEQIYVALLQCGFPVIDANGERWSERDAMVAYADERNQRSQSHGRIGNGHHA